MNKAVCCSQYCDPICKGPFTRCGSGCGNGAIINWITLYLMELFIRALAAVTVATVPQVNRFQPHSVHYIVCYFATAAAAQDGVGIQLITAPLPQPHRMNGP